MTLSTDGTSFRRADVTIKPRLVMAVDGLEGSGKTHFAFTAPGPIAHINFDEGAEGVVSKFRGKEILSADYRISAGRSDVETAKSAAEMWAKVDQDYRWALAHVRTVVIDTATEIWELLRLARFGKLTQIKPHHYGPVNAEYRQFVKLAYAHDANVILLHKLKDEYLTKVVGGKEVAHQTGKLIRGGMKDTAFLVQAVGRLRFDGPAEGFTMGIEKSRHNPALVGMEIPDPLVSFPEIAAMMIEGTTEEDWT